LTILFPRSSSECQAQAMSPEPGRPIYPHLS
jgi:hypothetical protein